MAWALPDRVSHSGRVPGSRGVPVEPQGPIGWGDRLWRASYMLQPSQGSNISPASLKNQEELDGARQSHLGAVCFPMLCALGCCLKPHTTILHTDAVGLKWWCLATGGVLQPRAS
jgi:hypothetical protein